MIAAASLAQVVRDRALWLALLMYVPIPALAIVASAWDAAWRGHALSRRWLLAGVCVVAGLGSFALQWTPAPAPEGVNARHQLKVAQWNLQWGGAHGQASVAEMMAALDERKPDLVCLSEAPAQQMLQAAWSPRHSGWSFASAEQTNSSAYWYRMTVMTRGQVARRREWALSTGHAALFEVSFPSRTLRVLMVDLLSSPFSPRSRSLEQVARVVNDYAAAGEPIDLIAGDFNTPGRFVGFEALAKAGQGYRRSAMWSGQWRATWPSWLPLSPFDIDHIWVRSDLQIADSEIFSSHATDHRGQTASLRW